ncbi:hypothetical protein F5Y16DRAFT_150801 [Xylariaceae sp. FL0255]|nr:hypothetical protein F5Y16DRAFT_150801 [Xylariaceae sp. FL0255]
MEVPNSPNTNPEGFEEAFLHPGQFNWDGFHQNVYDIMEIEYLERHNFNKTGSELKTEASREEWRNHKDTIAWGNALIWYYKCLSAHVQTLLGEAGDEKINAFATVIYLPLHPTHSTGRQEDMDNTFKLERGPVGKPRHSDSDIWSTEDSAYGSALVRVDEAMYVKTRTKIQSRRAALGFIQFNVFRQVEEARRGGGMEIWCITQLSHRPGRTPKEEEKEKKQLLKSLKENREGKNPKIAYYHVAKPSDVKVFEESGFENCCEVRLNVARVATFVGRLMLFWPFSKSSDETEDEPKRPEFPEILYQNFSSDETWVNPVCIIEELWADPGKSDCMPKEFDSSELLIGEHAPNSRGQNNVSGYQPPPDSSPQLACHDYSSFDVSDYIHLNTPDGSSAPEFNRLKWSRKWYQHYRDPARTPRPAPDDNYTINSQSSLSS